jgi:hypothetical protein
MGSA